MKFESCNSQEKIMRLKKLPSQERLKELFYYDNGNLYWKIAPRGHPYLKHTKAGSICKGNNYRYIRVDMNRYMAHRLIWVFFYGHDPIKFLDHINGDRLDNRIENIRSCAISENQINRTRNKKRNIPKGVREVPSGKYTSRIGWKGKSIHIGTFETSQKASEEYFRVSRSLYGSFARRDI